MKKILFVLLVMCFAVSVAFSQFGIKAGINLGTVGGADKAMDAGNNIKIDPTTKVGLAGGISYRIGLIAGFAIQPEVMYIQKGAIYQTSMASGNYSATGKSTVSGNYIDIPVLVKFNLPIPVFSPYVEGGVSYGILLSAKQKDEVTSNVPGLPSSSTETDIKDQLSKSDISLIIGVGVEFLILEIDARYVLGQTKLDKDGKVNAYNRGIILTAGLRF